MTEPRTALDEEEDVLDRHRQHDYNIVERPYYIHGRFIYPLAMERMFYRIMSIVRRYA